MSKKPVPKSCSANNYRRHHRPHRQGEWEDKEERPYTVPYDAVNAMLRRILRVHRAVTALLKGAVEQICSDEPPNSLKSPLCSCVSITLPVAS